MKRFKRIFMLLFFLSLIFCCLNSFNNQTQAVAKAFDIKNEIEFEIKTRNDNFSFKQNLFDNASDYKKEFLSKNGIKNAISILKNMEFSEEEIVCYLFPELTQETKNIFQKYSKKEIEDDILIYKNQCKLKINKGRKGEFVDKKLFYQQIIDNIVKNSNKIEINLALKKFKNFDIRKENFVKKSEFETNFSTSKEERKNNIKVALSKFDGIILNEGEELSFNKITGVRNKETGYMPAKIITDGTYVEGYGGGVCQVSTTLYNACLLAGMKAVEVHNHSLPVSYVKPSFDAMVSFGSSDLVLKNTTGSKIVITTSSEGDKCRVVIFGKENDYKIERAYKKIKTIEASKENIIETDYQKYGLFDLAAGEEKQISHAKDGFVSEGYLNYYDKENNLIKTEKIRETKYGATKGVVVKKEN